MTAKEKKVSFSATLTNEGQSFHSQDQYLIVPFVVTSVFII